MVVSDIVRAAVVVGFFYADAVWQIYALAVLLNLGSAVFTPIYRAVIPNVVTPEQYPRALAVGSIAYDTANILGPSLAALVIALVGFRGNFVVDALTFLGSAALLFGLPRLSSESTGSEKKPPTSVRHGLTAMFRRAALRESLMLALQTSIGGAFVIVATVDFVKNDLALTDGAYAWVMAAFGIGSVVGALIYARVSTGWRDGMVRGSAPVMIAGLVAVAVLPLFYTLTAAWLLLGMSYSILGIRGTELLASDSDGDERPHIYAAHFALSHAGWGLTYPLAGWLSTVLGFGKTAGIFAVMLILVSCYVWMQSRRSAKKIPSP